LFVHSSPFLTPFFLPSSCLDCIFFCFNNIIFILNLSEPLFQTTTCYSRVNERIDTDSVSRCWSSAPPGVGIDHSV
jgi:hypothetical protein